jgi:anti-anti-sigma factor
VKLLTDTDQETAVLSVCGEVDIATARVLRETLLPILEHRTGPVVVDLSEVPFMDSTGVHILVDTSRRLEGQNRRFAIACRKHGQVHRLLAVVGLLDHMTVHSSRDSAMSDGDELIHSKPGMTGRPRR